MANGYVAKVHDTVAVYDAQTDTVEKGIVVGVIWPEDRICQCYFPNRENHAISTVHWDQLTLLD